MISIFDAILLIALSGFVFYGFFFGLIRTIGVFAGLIVGIFVTTRVYQPILEMVSSYFFGFDRIGKIVVFILIFSIVSKLVSFSFFLIDRAFNIISIIPFLKTINRLSGAILGAAVGALAIGFFVYLASSNFIVEGLLGGYIVSSKLAPYFLKFSNLLLPLFPAIIKKAKELM